MSRHPSGPGTKSWSDHRRAGLRKGSGLVVSSGVRRSSQSLIWQSWMRLCSPGRASSSYRATKTWLHEIPDAARRADAGAAHQQQFCPKLVLWQHLADARSRLAKVPLLLNPPTGSLFLLLHRQRIPVGGRPQRRAQQRDPPAGSRSTRDIYPGHEFRPFSVDGGAQNDMNLAYHLTDGKWWLSVGGHHIGYLPGVALYAKRDELDEPRRGGR